MLTLLCAASEALRRNDAVALDSLVLAAESLRAPVEGTQDPELLGAVLRLTAQVHAAERGLAACGRPVPKVHAWAR